MDREELSLGIETSCDETSAAIVASGREVLSSIVSSQIALHAPYGGVVPEIASRHHVEAIASVVDAALREANVQLRDVGSIAVTYGPGLAGALLVGLNFAQGLALGLGTRIVPVNHLEGHLHSVWLTRGLEAPAPPPPLPLMALIVSGGHTQLVVMRAHGSYDVVGRTLDDAAGEAFDKVARLLGLSYPGGPSIQRAAASAQSPHSLPRAWLHGTYDFSFSGLKTAVLHAVFELATGKSAHSVRGTSLPRVDVASGLTAAQVADVAAGFEESVTDVLVKKTLRAADEFEARAIAVVGGVAANKRLRERMLDAATLPLFLSLPEFSTDNAAMIAAAGFYHPIGMDVVDVRPSLGLTA